MDKIVIKKYDLKKRNERGMKIEYCPYLSTIQNIRIMIKALEYAVEDYKISYKEERIEELEKKIEKSKKELNKLKNN